MMESKKNPASNTGDDHGSAPRGVLSALHRCQNGTSLTEFVITLPIFLVLLSGLLSFQDLLYRMTLTEVQAYQNTANAAMEVQRTGVAEADGDDQLRNHLEHESAGGYTSDQLSDDAYPPIRPPAALDFRGSFRSQMASSHTSFDQALGNSAWAFNRFNQPPDKVRPLFEGNIDNQFEVRNRLFGSNRSAAYTLPDGDYLRRGHLGSLEGDLFFGELMEEGDGFLTNQASLFGTVMGTRYGVLARHATHEHQHEIMRFDYELDYGSYYSTSVPQSISESAEVKNDRSTVVSRIMLRGKFYDSVLRIGFRSDGVPDYDPNDCRFRLCEVDPDNFPDPGADLFDGSLTY